MRLLKLTNGHVIDLEQMTMLSPPVKIQMPGQQLANASIFFGPLNVQLTELDYKVVENAVAGMIEDQDAL
jgi:hypothetical protein